MKLLDRIQIRHQVPVNIIRVSLGPKQEPWFLLWSSGKTLSIVFDNPIQGGGGVGPGHLYVFVLQPHYLNTVGISYSTCPGPAYIFFQLR
ncbi:hypothetical protein ACN42_g7289 [Penicillium freii]|uniref:Uncharacterized protein n=1 Tax=Penicillium freii TaxID=48697 RepID=A0A101MFW4_PENFR|nr:hypothetical protein ACN42_g7289 [Penicillium freii]